MNGTPHWNRTDRILLDLCWFHVSWPIVSQTDSRLEYEVIQLGQKSGVSIYPSCLNLGLRTWTNPVTCLVGLSLPYCLVSYISYYDNNWTTWKFQPKKIWKNWLGSKALFASWTIVKRSTSGVLILFWYFLSRCRLYQKQVICKSNLKWLPTSF